jgi:hypothetical protein
LAQARRALEARFRRFPLPANNMLCNINHP